MLIRFWALSLVLGPALVGPALSEVIQLRDKATVSGKVLAEKKDQVVVDIGYTVLTIPRNQIAKIVPDEAPRSSGNSHSAKTAPKRGEGERAREPLPVVPDTENQLFQGPRSGSAERSVRELVNQLGEAVVQVRTPGGLGSGFILNEEGYLITNFHVIEGETQISIEVYHMKNGQLDRPVYKQVRIVAMNKFQDLALLKIDDHDAPKFSRVSLAEADALAVGERVFAIGSPLGLERTVTEGIVSTKTRLIQGELYLQTTAQINPGNSGGPLFNMRGEVVGVTNMKLAFGEGLGFAIPVEAVRYFLKHRDAFAYDNDNPSTPYRYLEPPSRLKSRFDRDSSTNSAASAR
ncbi:MAG TPA: trypsin-like peptidase domain-containing protein [Verrucomicrobiae bacterium]|nr:trypsin-like peptidase domain-containing protein [Verrucomicrobiae bacterium]